jgi:hypothetical protein
MSSMNWIDNDVTSKETVYHDVWNQTTSKYFI